MWVKTRVNGRSVYTESVTLANAGTANSSRIDFIPRGVGFTVHANTGAVNTVGAVTTDLEGSFNGTTFVDVDASFLADLDTAVKTAVYVASTSGDYPYYRLSFDSAADDSSTVIAVVVIPTA